MPNGDFDSQEVLGIARRYRLTQSTTVLNELLDAILKEENQSASVRNLFGQQRSEPGDLSPETERQIVALQAQLNAKSLTALERSNLCLKIRELRGRSELFTAEDRKNRP